MGSEDLFHKRKAKLKRDTARHKANREPYDKVLIVCEGTKTEPYYFAEIKDHYKIATANIKIASDCGSSPTSVLEHAISIYQEAKSSSNQYDRVYCVFDQDRYHLEPTNQYQKAIDRIASFKPKNTFFAINSVPCFEYWFLLHYEYTTAPFSAVGGVTVGQAVLKKLTRYWPGYTKAINNSFEHLLPQLQFAIHNSKRALSEAIKNHNDNPSTHAHELVEYLQRIKKM